MVPLPPDLAAMTQPDLSGARRISVVGTTGAGKSTFAARLARLVDAPHVELDALHWEPNWVGAAPDVFRARVRAAVAGPRWVVDGNYSIIREEVWARADAVVWLDFTFGVIFGRLLLRTILRAWRREELWSGCRESFRMSFCSRESVLLWAIQTYARRRATYPGLFERPEYRHLRVARLRTPRAADDLLAAIRPVPDPTSSPPRGLPSRAGPCPPR